MLVLQTFFPAFGLPDPSPFVIKAMVLLKMSGLEFSLSPGNLLKSPKGKMPVLQDGDQLIADSSFIRLHLETAHGIDFDPGLSRVQKAHAWALEKMMEDHLYWAIVSERWMDDANFAKGPRVFFEQIPKLMRPLAVFMVKRQMRRNLWGHGMGRHDNKQILELGNRSLSAISDVLADQPFMMGDRPTGLDASAYAFLAVTMVDIFDSGLKDTARSSANLSAYVKRLNGMYFPDYPAP